MLCYVMTFCLAPCNKISVHNVGGEVVQHTSIECESRQPVALLKVSWLFHLFFIFIFLNLTALIFSLGH